MPKTPPQPKAATRKKRTTRRDPGAGMHLWLAPFTFRSLPDSEGTFQLAIEAPSPEEAMDRCREQLRAIYRGTSLLGDPVEIYSDGLVQLDARFPYGALVNLHVFYARGSSVSLLPLGEQVTVFFPRSLGGNANTPFLRFGYRDEVPPGLAH